MPITRSGSAKTGDNGNRREHKQQAVLEHTRQEIHEAIQKTRRFDKHTYIMVSKIEKIKKLDGP